MRLDMALAAAGCRKLLPLLALWLAAEGFTGTNRLEFERLRALRECWGSDAAVSRVAAAKTLKGTSRPNELAICNTLAPKSRF